MFFKKSFRSDFLFFLLLFFVFFNFVFFNSFFVFSDDLVGITDGNGNVVYSVSSSDSKSFFSDYDFSIVRINGYSDYIYGLACNCKFDDSCEGFFKVYCSSTKSVLPSYLRWSVDIFKNPVNTVCNVFVPKVNYQNFGVSLENHDLSDVTFPLNSKLNLYILASKTLMDENYFYYFKFYFSPMEEYSSNNVKFKFLVDGSYETADFKVEPESDNGFTFIKTLTTNKNIEKVCMYFDEKPKGFSDNYYCSNVVFV